MGARRARLYDVVALLAAILVISLDQWTKFLIVANLSPAESKPPIPLLGQYLVIDYIQNRGAAFSFLQDNSIFLTLFILAAIAVVGYLYIRMINHGPLFYKLIFGLIIGGAIGNLIDRVHNGGFVVDFLSFRIPEINFYFAVFNVADACISVGVMLLFLFVLVGNVGRNEPVAQQKEDVEQPSVTTSGSLHTTEQDAKN